MKQLREIEKKRGRDRYAKHEEGTHYKRRSPSRLLTMG